MGRANRGAREATVASDVSLLRRVVTGGRRVEDRVEWRNREGQLHRVDEPAVIHEDGTKEWWENGEWLHTRRYNEEGELHAEGKPAVQTPNGNFWWEHGRCRAFHSFTVLKNESGEIHADEGPAVIHEMREGFLTEADYEKRVEEYWNNGTMESTQEIYQPLMSHPQYKRLTEYRKVWKNPEGVIHKEGGPALIDYEEGIVWHKDGEVYNSAGPSVIHPGGGIEFNGWDPPPRS